MGRVKVELIIGPHMQNQIPSEQRRVLFGNEGPIQALLDREPAHALLTSLGSLGVPSDSSFGQFTQAVIVETGIHAVLADSRKEVLHYDVPARRRWRNDLITVKRVRKAIGEEMFGGDQEEYAKRIQTLLAQRDSASDQADQVLPEELDFVADLRAYPLLAAQTALLAQERTDKVNRDFFAGLSDFTYEPYGEAYLIKGKYKNKPLVVINREVDSVTEEASSAYELTLRINSQLQPQDRAVRFASQYVSWLQRRHEIEQQIATQIGLSRSIPDEGWEDTLRIAAKKVLVAQGDTNHVDQKLLDRAEAVEKLWLPHEPPAELLDRNPRPVRRRVPQIALSKEKPRAVSVAEARSELQPLINQARKYRSDLVFGARDTALALVKSQPHKQWRDSKTDHYVVSFNGPPQGDSPWVTSLSIQDYRPGFWNNKRKTESISYRITTRTKDDGGQVHELGTSDTESPWVRGRWSTRDSEAILFWNTSNANTYYKIADQFRKDYTEVHLARLLSSLVVVTLLNRKAAQVGVKERIALPDGIKEYLEKWSDLGDSGVVNSMLATLSKVGISLEDVVGGVSHKH